MDSMRLWDKKTHESLDKDVYRFNKGDVMATYNRVAQRITKKPVSTAGKRVMVRGKAKVAGKGKTAIKKPAAKPAVKKR
jgi:phosphoribosylaminoimidazole-succinocarboxamide synthase